MKLFKIIRKYYEYLVTKINVLIEQKSFDHNGVSVKYILKENKNSEDLIIVFSACTRPGLAARYNYMKSLNGINANRLYILDDFGPDGRGSYYLGKNLNFTERDATLALVNKIIKEKNFKRIFLCGSCKGAYGALSVGCTLENSIMVIGEPTYKIATEFGKNTALMEYWMGEVTPENVEHVDEYLASIIKDNPYIDSQKVHLFYSNTDEYYERHMLPLLNDLRLANYNLDIEEATFMYHSELGLYFPDFLISTLKRFID